MYVKGLGLYIVNGRIRGDSLGRLTQCSVLGSSVVDYAITDIEPQYINASTVSPQQPLSDRSQITLFLKKSLSTTVNPNPEPRLFPLQEIQMDRREHCCLYRCTRLCSNSQACKGIHTSGHTSLKHIIYSVGKRISFKILGKRLVHVKKMHYMEGELNKIEKAINENTF